MEAVEGQLRPFVGPTLLGERAAYLGYHQRVAQHEHQRQHDQPEEPLRTIRRDRPQRVQADERADGEEDHVDAPERLDELRLLLERERGGVLDELLVRGCWPCLAQTSSLWTS